MSLKLNTINAQRRIRRDWHTINNCVLTRDITLYYHGVFIEDLDDKPAN